MKLPKTPGQEKVPFWKKKWFWGVVIAIIIVGAVGNHSDEPSEPAIAYQDAEVLEEVVIEEEPEIDEAELKAQAKAEKEEKRKAILEEADRISAEREQMKQSADPEEVVEEKTAYELAQEATRNQWESYSQDEPEEISVPIPSGAAEAQPTLTTYLLNTDSKVIHKNGSYHNGNPENSYWQTVEVESLDELLADEYTQCGICWR